MTYRTTHANLAKALEHVSHAIVCFSKQRDWGEAVGVFPFELNRLENIALDISDALQGSLSRVDPLPYSLLSVITNAAARPERLTEAVALRIKGGLSSHFDTLAWEADGVGVYAADDGIVISYHGRKHCLIDQNGMVTRIK